jgi:dehydrogenase/reductase SDR family protein 4
MNNSMLSGKIALITGASKGIGLAIARCFVNHGATVIITSRNETLLKEACESAGVIPGKLVYKVCHVGRENELIELMGWVNEHFGGLDILVNNAATNPVAGPIELQNSQLFDKIIDVNVKSAFVLSNLAFEGMKKKGKGSIIHISSVEAFRPSTGLGLYAVSKAALNMLGFSQAKEWAKYGIRANVICPGLIKTKFSAAIWQNEAFLKQWETQIPVGRMGEPEEIAQLALFLASEASSYCTGMHFNADGGYLISP